MNKRIAEGEQLLADVDFPLGREAREASTVVDAQQVLSGDL